MYFVNRAQAGRLLADQLESLRASNTAVVALSAGGVLVGAQIAMRLHSSLVLLMTENIKLPGEPDPLGAVSSANVLTYNDVYSAGQIEDFSAEYFNLVEQQRMEGVHRLHRLLGANGEVRRDLLRHHNIILVSDALSNGFSLAIAADYLKPVKIGKLIAAVPVANVAAVDRMHLLADEIHCLSVVDNFLATNHYYSDNNLPDLDAVFKIIRNLPVYWQQAVT